MIKVNPLTITKPEYKDNIYEAYLDGGDEFDVIVVKRFTPDMVRKFTYAFNTKGRALTFIKSLYKTSTENCDLSNLEPKVDSCMDKTEKCDRPQETTDSTQDIKPKRKNFSFGDDEDLKYQEEMKALRNKPIVIHETNVSGSKKMKWDL